LDSIKNFVKDSYILFTKADKGHCGFKIVNYSLKIEEMLSDSNIYEIKKRSEDE